MSWSMSWQHNSLLCGCVVYLLSVVCGGLLCPRIKDSRTRSFTVALCDIPAQVVRLAVVVVMMIMMVMKSWDYNGFRTDHSISKQIKCFETHHVLPLGDPQLCTSVLFKFPQHKVSSLASVWRPSFFLLVHSVDLLSESLANSALEMKWRRGGEGWWWWKQSAFREFQL
jgi:hypothetical protein